MQLYLYLVEQAKLSTVSRLQRRFKAGVINSSEFSHQFLMLQLISVPHVLSQRSALTNAGGNF